MESEAHSTEEQTTAHNTQTSVDDKITTSSTASTPDTSNQMLFGILAYIGILVIIPFLMAKDDTFVRFHIKQGLVLCCGWLILWVVGSMLWMLLPIIWLVNLFLLVLAIIGIVNVVQHKEAPLPLVGHFADKISI